MSTAEEAFIIVVWLIFFNVKAVAKDIDKTHRPSMDSKDGMIDVSSNNAMAKQIINFRMSFT